MRGLVMCCFFLLSINGLMAHPLDDSIARFDVKQADRVFDHINLQLSTQNLNLNGLNAAVDVLSGYTKQAEQCVTVETKKLSRINALLPQNASSSDKNTADADLQYLTAEKKKITRRLSQCRLFSIRAHEAIDAYNKALAQLTQEETLTPSLPLWNVIGQLIESPPKDAFQAILHIQIPVVLTSLLVWALLICAALLVSFFLCMKARKTHVVKHFFYTKKLHARHVLLFSFCLLVGVIKLYLSMSHPVLAVPAVLLNLIHLLFVYLVIATFIVLMSKIKRVNTLLSACFLDSQSCRSVLLVCLTFYMLALMGQALNHELKLNELLLQLIHTVFFLILLGTSVYFVYHLCYSYRHIGVIKRYHRVIQRVMVFLLLTCAVSSLFGYYPLAIRLASSGLTTIVILFISILVIYGIHKIYCIACQRPSTQIIIMKYFGYKPTQVFMEFLILKTTLQVVTVAFSVFLIVRCWGFASYYLENIYSQVIYGIHVANVTLYPTRIVLGIVVYCVLYLLFRNISTLLSRHQQFEGEEETQVAIASIFTYIGFALALISALLVAGFNFTGLAIVAGALSVGIGLGLQSIVNNFVSGLILLIEKPIKPGDRINIDGVEGFVKKIRVRSTHIVTPVHEDVIVPNSDLITHRVTNYVYSDQQLFIHCEVNVPLGSDTQQVRDLLLTAANNHDDVIKQGRNKPYVLFSAFGEKSLVFNLCCLIKDVNKKLLVQSDLNFAIDKLLRENQI